MSIFRTPTPPYEKQPSSSRPAEASGVSGWFEGLIRTPTPAYTYPTPAAKEARGPADPSES